jgi:hypothetical protein
MAKQRAITRPLWEAVLIFDVADITLVAPKDGGEQSSNLHLPTCEELSKSA